MIGEVFGQAGVVIVECRLDQRLERRHFALAAMLALALSIPGRLRCGLAFAGTLAGPLALLAANLQRLLPLLQAEYDIASEMASCSRSR